MRRTLFVCALLLTLLPSSWAADAPAPTETVIRLTVRPAPAPKPALKYQLLPEMREMNPGNPIQAYSLCFGEQRNFWYSKQAVENREKWQTMPLKELPLEEMRKWGYGGGNPLRYADYAARLDRPDWQILLQIKREGSKLLLPNIQQLRELASALKVRFRVEIAERRFDDAIVTAKTMLGLSRHLGEHPTLIGNLVGIAVANLAIASPLEEMIQQPGCPNLFWALTDLPHPFIDLRKGLKGERVFLMADLAPLDDRQAMTDAQLQKAMDHIRQLMKNINVEKDVSKWLTTLAKDEGYIRAARQRLIDSGLAEAKVKTFPPSQVILLDEKLEYEVRRDEAAKVMALPFWQAEPILHARRQPKGEREDTLFAGLATSGRRMKLAQVRLEQRLGLLRCVEALRLHAAEHGGKLPATLADVKLPLPVDAVTGKLFVYELKGDTAIVRGTPPPGQENVAAYNVRYEVAIAK
jgi:hypothetical protein